MKLLLYGANQNSTSHDDIQKYLLSDEEAAAQLNDLKKLDGVEELIIYNNEWFTEYYFLVDETLFQHGDFLTYLSAHTEKEIDEVILDTYSKFNDDLITHLLTVLVGIGFDRDSVAFISDAEQALLASEGVLENIFLNQLFTQAIQFVSELHTSPELYDIFQSKTDMVLQQIIACFRRLYFKRFYLFGSEEYITALGKMLYRNGARHITVSSIDQAGDEEMARTLNKWVGSLSSRPVKKNFYTPDNKNAQLYYLSSADGIIIEKNTQDPDWDERRLYEQFTHSLQRVETLRHNKKKQCVFILNPGSGEMGCDNMDQQFYYINPDTDDEATLTIQPELEAARGYFERQAELATEKLFASYKNYSKEI